MPKWIKSIIFVAAIVISVLWLSKAYFSKQFSSNSVLNGNLLFEKNRPASCGIKAFSYACYVLDLKDSLRSFEKFQLLSDSRLGIVTLSEIGNALISVGASIRYEFAASVEQLVDKCVNGTVGVVHLNSSPEGHFIALRRLPPSDNKEAMFEIIDGMEPIRTLTESQMSAFLLGQFSGAVLIVSKGNIFHRVRSLFLDAPMVDQSRLPKVAQLDDVWPDSRHVTNQTVGALIVESTIKVRYDASIPTLRVPVKVVNLTDNIESIITIKGSCKCFLGIDMELPIRIDPRDEVQFHSLFSVKDLSPGSPVFLAIATAGSNPAQIEVLPTPTSGIAPFFRESLKSLGYVSSRTPIASDFFLIGTVPSSDLDTNVLSSEPKSPATNASVVRSFKTVIAGETFHVDQVRLSRDNTRLGPNVLEGEILTSAGNLLRVEVFAYATPLIANDVSGKSR